MTEVRPGYISDGNNNWIQIGPSIPLGSTVYYQASEPGTPQTGDIWIDSDNEVPSIDNSQFLRWRKTVSGGETSLSGLDDSGLSLQYTPAYEQVYLNGVLLVRGDDYTATTGTSITGLTALAASDVVEVFSVVARVVGDVYTQSQSDNKYSPITTTGLVLLNTTSFSAATSVSVDNVFSSSYKHYKAIFETTAVSDADMSFKWYGRTGGSDVTSNYAFQRIYTRSTTLASQSGSDSTFAFTTNGKATSCQFEFFISGPQLAQETSTFCAPIAANSVGDPYMNLMWSRHTSTNQFDGIKFFTSSGTMTGAVKIYGYK